MRAGTQVSVFLVDKPGVLVRVCDALAQKKVNLVAMTLMDSVEHGVLRFVCEDLERARSALRALNIPYTETEVLMIELPNRPGAMADLAARLNAAHIHIKYAYVTVGAPGGRTLGIFKVSDMHKALKVANHQTLKRRRDLTLRRPRALRA